MNWREWRHCTLNDQRNGIMHVPTSSVFRIEEGNAVFVRTAEIGGASEERIGELKVMAVTAFKTVRPMWKPRDCRHPHI
jgi:hypothetical protein